MWPLAKGRVPTTTPKKDRRGVDAPPAPAPAPAGGGGGGGDPTVLAMEKIARQREVCCVCACAACMGGPPVWACVAARVGGVGSCRVLGVASASDVRRARACCSCPAAGCSCCVGCVHRLIDRRGRAGAARGGRRVPARPRGRGARERARGAAGGRRLPAAHQRVPQGALLREGGCARRRDVLGWCMLGMFWLA